MCEKGEKDSKNEDGHSARTNALSSLCELDCSYSNPMINGRFSGLVAFSQ